MVQVPDGQVDETKPGSGSAVRVAGLGVDTFVLRTGQAHEESMGLGEGTMNECIG